MRGLSTAAADRLKNINIFLKKITADDVAVRAAGVSFYILTAFFPCVIIIFIAAGYMSINAEEMLVRLVNMLPADVGGVIDDVLTNISMGRHLVIMSSVLTMWTMSNALITIAKSLNIFYEADETRNFFVFRIYAFGHAFLLLSMILVSLVAFVFGGVMARLFERFIAEDFLIMLWEYARYIVGFVFVTLIFAFIFKTVPNKRLKYRDVMPGALITSAVWMASSYAFSFYVNNFSRYHILYGSFAGIVILFSWTYLTSFVVLLGGEINAAIYMKKCGRTVRKD